MRSRALVESWEELPVGVANACSELSACDELPAVDVNANACTEREKRLRSAKEVRVLAEGKICVLIKETLDTLCN